MKLRKFEITFAEDARRRLKKEKHLYTPEDILSVRTWIDEMTRFGPAFIKESRHYGDHELVRDEKWKGCRSSCVSQTARIIYKVIHGEIVIIEIQRITLNHDYK